ncbi:hypothetical protein IEO21_11030 [Rhodonia placenta]|uniref:Uncharacterized protein n=1 Tax=Rhodonia placenta TaxID=104341 RepID=A0A8H7TWY9_9APHY|nr:hypothetical protein IEO21_11030 [Postia placenta]
MRHVQRASSVTARCKRGAGSPCASYAACGCGGCRLAPQQPRTLDALISCTRHHTTLNTSPPLIW